MAPVRYRNNPGLRTLRQDALDEALVYEGLHVRDDGKLGRRPCASTLSEAAQHASSLRAELRRRGTHPDVLRYCTDEILTKNAFYAMLEASKSVFDKLRERTGLPTHGAPLIDAALALGKSGSPLLAINRLTTQTERDEQTRLANLIKGLSGMFRNPVAHDPRFGVLSGQLMVAVAELHIHRGGGGRVSMLVFTTGRCTTMPAPWSWPLRPARPKHLAGRAARGGSCGERKSCREGMRTR